MNDSERVVRIDDGALGWRHGHEIIMDMEPDWRLATYYRWNSKADQEDFGVPAAGWLTAIGYWLPVEEQEEQEVAV